MVSEERTDTDPALSCDDGVRGLALAIREGLLLIVRYIEWRYGKEQAPRRRSLDDKRV